MAYDFSEPVRPEPPKRPELPKVRRATVQQRDFDPTLIDNPGLREVFADEIRSVQRDKDLEQRDIEREERDRRAYNTAAERFNERLRSYRQDTRNAAFEEKARRDGMKFYKDEFGNYRPELDPLTNKPVFDAGILGETEKDGERWQVVQDRDGKRHLRKPKMKESADPNDPFFYYEWSDGTREKAYHADDIARMDGVDEDVRQKALKRSEKLRGSLKNSVQDVLTDRVAAANIKKAEAQKRLLELKQRYSDLIDRVNLLDEKRREEGKGLFNDPSPSTLQALADVQAKADAVSKEMQDINKSLDEGGLIHSEVAIAEGDESIFKDLVEIGGIEEVERRILSGNFAGSDKAAEQLLSALETEKERIGFNLSKSAADRNASERLIVEAMAEERERLEQTDEFSGLNLDELSEARRNWVEAYRDMEATGVEMSEEFKQFYQNDFGSREQYEKTRTSLIAKRDGLLRQQGTMEARRLAIINATQAAYGVLTEETAQVSRDLIYKRDAGMVFGGGITDIPRGIRDAAYRINAMGTEGGRQIEQTFEGVFELDAGKAGAGAVKTGLSMLQTFWGSAINITAGALGHTDENIEWNAEVKMARQILREVPDEKVPELLFRMGQMEETLSAKNVDPEKRRIVPKGRGGALERLQNGLILLENGDWGAFQSFLRPLEKTSEFGFKLIGHGADIVTGGYFVDFSEMLDFTDTEGVDFSNVEDVAAYNALYARYYETLSEKFPNAELTGEVFASVGEFFTATKLGKLTGSGLKKIPVGGKVYAKVGQKLGSTDKLDDFIGYGYFGAAQSFRETPTEMGFVDRLLDVSWKAATIGFAERVGQKWENRFNKVFKPAPTLGNLTLRQMAFAGGMTFGETIAEGIEAGLNGESLIDTWDDVLQGSATMGVAFTALNGYRGIRLQNRFNSVSSDYGKVLMDARARYNDLQKAVELSAELDEGGDALDVLGREKLENLRDLYHSVMSTAIPTFNPDGKISSEMVRKARELRVAMESRGKGAEETEGGSDVDGIISDLDGLGEHLALSIGDLAILSDASRKVQIKLGLTLDSLAEINAPFIRNTADQEAFDADLSRSDDALRFARNRQMEKRVEGSDVNRQAGRGLLRLSLGNPVMTSAEERAIKNLEKEGDVSFTRTIEGQTILTDAGQEFLAGLSPTTEKLVKGNETDRVSHARRRAKALKEMKEMERDLADDGFGDDPVAFIPEKGEDLKMAAVQLPGAEADAKPEASAAAQRVVPVRDAQATANDPRVTPAMLARTAKKILGDEAVRGKQTEEGAKAAAKEINAAIDIFGRFFDAVEINDRGADFGMMAVVGKDGKRVLELNPSGMVGDGDILAGGRGRAAAVAQEELGHRILLQLVPEAEVRSMWDALPDELKATVREAYTGKVGKEQEGFVLGHEFLRMLLQGRLNLNTEGMAALSEETGRSGWVAKVRKLLDRIINIAKDIRGSLEAEGVEAQWAERIDAVITQAEGIYKSLPTQKQGAKAQTGESTQTEKESAAKEGNNKQEDTDEEEGQVQSQGQRDDGQSRERPQARDQRKKPKVLETESAERVAEALGQDPGDLGKFDQVSHREDTYGTVYAVIEASDLRPSHDDEGRLLNDYPKGDLQPRDREGQKYIDQVRKMSANFKEGEEAKTGGADSGVPIMVPIRGKAYTLIGNGRAAARQRMWEQHPETAEATREWILDNAEDFGISRGQVEGMKQPVLVRVLTEEHSNEYLRHISEESNKPNAMEASDFENAKMYARRISRRALGMLNPDYGLDADANKRFMELYLEETGQTRDANKSEKDYADQAELVLFIKAYGADEASFASLSRLTGNAEDSSKRITTALSRQAKTFADLRFQQGQGELYPVSVSNELMRAAQDIEVALRNKRYDQPVSDVLEGLLEQEMLGIDENTSRTPLEKDVLWFLVNYRNNQRVMEDVLSVFADAVYGAGSPLQGSLFGASAGMGPRTMWDNAVRMVLNRENAQRAEKKENPLPMPPELRQEEVNADETQFSQTL